MALTEVADTDDITAALFNRVQAGSTGSVTTDAAGDVFVTFPLPYTARPSIIGIRKTSGTSQKACHVASSDALGCKFTITDDDARQISVSGVVVHWVAIGNLA